MLKVIRLEFFFIVGVMLSRCVFWVVMLYSYWLKMLEYLGLLVFFGVLLGVFSLVIVW